MKSARLIACLLLLLMGVAGAQSTYTVELGKTLVLDLPGSTAAYSLGSYIADASFLNGAVRIAGLDAGKTTVIVITPGGIKTLQVTVVAPAQAVGTASSGAHNESGNYSVQYGSDPQQVTNTLDYTRQIGSAFQRLQIADSAYLSRTSSFTTLPTLSLQLHSGSYDATFLDQRVDNTALTVQQVVVRGFHFAWKDWSLHAGYASMMAYQNVLLAVDPEYVIGVSRRFRLSKNALMSGNLYYFHNPASAQGDVHNGPILTYAFDYRREQSMELKAEVGVGGAPALAVAAMADNFQHHVIANFRILPNNFKSLALNSQHGMFGDLQFSEIINSRYSALFSTSLADYDLPVLKEKTFSFNGDLTRRIGQRFALTAGSTYSRFSSPTPPASTYQSMSVPVGLNYHSRSFSAGAQYLPTTDLAGHFATGYEFNSGVPIRRFQVSASYRHDVQVPTVTSILAQVPALQDLLLRAGIVAGSLNDILALLNNSTELNALGFGNLVGLNLSSTRDDFSAGLNWVARGKHQQSVNATFYDSSSKMAVSQLHFRSEAVVYARKLRFGDEMTAAVSLYQTDLSGGSSVHPAIQVSFRHSLKSLPLPMLLKHHGNILGHVFFDPTSSYRYSSSMSGVDGAEVWLDEQRKVRTDAHGYYSFAGVPYGDHRIEVKFNSSEPYFFTTDSPATASVNSTVDFGLNFVMCQIFGVLRNDAGAAIPAIVVVLKGNGTTRQMLSGGDGSFQFRGLPSGNYTVSTDVASYPPGYNLQDVEEKTFDVEPGAPSHADFAVRALRSISGIVTAYDPALLKAVPQGGVVVRILKPGIETKTDAKGHYILRRVPSGTLTVTAERAVTAERPGSSRSQKVEVPPQPGDIRDTNFMLQ